MSPTYKLLLLAALALPVAMNAQTAAIVGYPANFDAYNNTGQPVYGFEIDADGITTADVTRIFGGTTTCWIRYCQGTAIAYPGGVKFIWSSPYDPATQQFTLSTPTPNGTVAGGESCWIFGLGPRYPAAGCEHFGISTLRNPTNVIYYWLVADPQNPGLLMKYTGNPSPNALPSPVSIPQPYINLVPAAQAGAQPGVAFDIQVPRPPVPPAQFGDAQWVKVYKLEVNRDVDLDELMGGNAVVPEGAAQMETEWKLLQSDPGSNRKGALRHVQPLGGGSHAVVRRYEHYKYTGAYNAATHEAMCVNLSCTSPADGELGIIIGAQNAAANIDVPSFTVTKVGTGNVAGGPISCGNGGNASCSANVNAGTVITVTATAPGNAEFLGWTGACTGSQASCTVTVNDVLNTTATFKTLFKLSVGKTSSGTTVATPNGEFNSSINCGSSCNASYLQDTVVTLSATPAAGRTFTGWSGACFGTATTCTVTMGRDTSVTANYK